MKERYDEKRQEEREEHERHCLDVTNPSALFSCKEYDHVHGGTASTDEKGKFRL